MVLPYLKVLINKEKFIYLSLVIFGYIFFISYLQVRSITSGIRALSWTKRRFYFLFFCRNFLGCEFAD